MASPTSSPVHLPFLLRDRRALWRHLPQSLQGIYRIIQERQITHWLFHSSSEDSILRHCTEDISCSNVFVLLSHILQLHTTTVHTQLSSFVQHTFFTDSSDKHPLHLLNVPAKHTRISCHCILREENGDSSHLC